MHPTNTQVASRVAPQGPRPQAAWEHQCLVPCLALCLALCQVACAHQQQVR